MEKLLLVSGWQVLQQHEAPGREALLGWEVSPRTGFTSPQLPAHGRGDELWCQLLFLLCPTNQ